MAFQGGINPQGTPTTPPGPRTRPFTLAPFVAGEVKTQTTPDRPPPQVIMPVSAGLFGGIQPEHTRAAEIRERVEARARQAERFNPPQSTKGPLLSPEFELGLPQPIGTMPKMAAAVFAAALQRGRVA